MITSAVRRCTPGIVQSSSTAGAKGRICSSIASESRLICSSRKSMWARIAPTTIPCSTSKRPSSASLQRRQLLGSLPLAGPQAARTLLTNAAQTDDCSRRNPKATTRQKPSTRPAARPRRTRTRLRRMLQQLLYVELELGGGATDAEAAVPALRADLEGCPPCRRRAREPARPPRPRPGSLNRPTPSSCGRTRARSCTRRRSGSRRAARPQSAAPARVAVQPHDHHLRGERAVERAAEQRVREHARRPASWKPSLKMQW